MKTITKFNHEAETISEAIGVSFEQIKEDDEFVLDLMFNCKCLSEATEKVYAKMWADDEFMRVMAFMLVSLRRLFFESDLVRMANDPAMPKIFRDKLKDKLQDDSNDV